MNDALIDRWDEQFTPFVPRLRKALEETFRGLIGDTPTDEVAGLAVYADHDGAWLNAAAETFADLDEKQARKPEIGREYRWSPAEWSRNDLDVLQPRPLTELMREVHQAIDVSGVEDSLDWVLLVMNWVVDQLGAMLRDGWFDEFDEGLVLVVDILDRDMARETRMEWMQALNEPELAADYGRWLRGDYAL